MLEICSLKNKCSSEPGEVFKGPRTYRNFKRQQDWNIDIYSNVFSGLSCDMKQKSVSSRDEYCSERTQ